MRMARDQPELGATRRFVALLTGMARACNVSVWSCTVELSSWSSPLAKPQLDVTDSPAEMARKQLAETMVNRMAVEGRFTGCIHVIMRQRNRARRTRMVKPSASTRATNIMSDPR